MSEPFNSPRQALDWLKKRNAIESIEGLTIHRINKPLKWYSPGDIRPPEDGLDDAAEEMLKRYGHVFKKTKLISFSYQAVSEAPLPLNGATTSGVFVTYFTGSMNANASANIAVVPPATNGPSSTAQ
jgi:hypothetical protein